MILYGIPNCNTVKKARDWLSENQLNFEFHNFKKDGLDKNTLMNWVKDLGWEVLLNKKGMTWRKLTDAQKTDLDQDKAVAIMLENTSIIKRPVLDYNGQIHVGFKEEDYQFIFKK